MRGRANGYFLLDSCFFKSCLSIPVHVIRNHQLDTTHGLRTDQGEQKPTRTRVTNPTRMGFATPRKPINARIASMNDDLGYGLLTDAALLVDGSDIAWIGPMSNCPARPSANVVDCAGRYADSRVHRVRIAGDAGPV